MKKANERDLINAGIAALHDRLRSELKNTDDDAAAEQFICAEVIIDQYLHAIEERSTSWPDRQELAYACIHVLVTTQSLTKDDLELLGRLNALSVGISMFAISPQVADMKTRVIANIERMAAAEVGGPVQQPFLPLPEDDVPF